MHVLREKVIQHIMAGQFDFMCEQTSLVTPFVQSGRVKAIAVTSPKRLALLPGVPTTAEEGLGAVDLGVWHGIYAPKGTPPSAIDKLSAALVVALRDPEVHKRFAEFSAEIATPDRGRPAPLLKLQQAEDVRWAPILEAAAEYAD